MLPDPPPPSRLRDLAIDLTVERQRLEALITSLEQLGERWQRDGALRREAAWGLSVDSIAVSADWRRHGHPHDPEPR